MSPQLHSNALNLYFLFYKVRRKLSEITEKFWTDLEIYSSLNNAQLDIASKSQCLTKNVTVTTISGTQEYDLKDNGFSDIIDISEDGVYFYQNGTAYNPLTYKSKKQLDKEFPGWQGVSASVPQFYYYDKPTQTIGLYPKTNSSNAGAYLFIDGIYAPKILHAGTASAGSTTTITLPEGSSTAAYPNPTDDYYNNIYIEIYGGTGAGQKAEITDYVGSTRVCTATFSTAPDSTSVYGMIPQIPERAHNLIYLYAIADMLEKGGSRVTLANYYWSQYNRGVSLFIGDTLENPDEEILKESYR